MESKLEQYLDAALESYGNSSAIQDIKPELLQDLLDKFRDLKEQGKSDQEAFAATIASVGDIAELIPDGQKPHAPRKKTIQHGSLHDADMAASDASGAHFNKNDLKNANLSNSNLIGSSFEQSNLQGAAFDGSDLTDATFHEASLAGASFKNCKLHNTAFKRTDLSDVSFEGQALIGTAFIGTSLKNTSFKNAVLRNVTFEDIRQGKKATFDGATMDKLTYAIVASFGADISNVIITN
jgi:uncharacterized protein YjbI with pentapeptide repeats